MSNVTPFSAARSERLSVGGAASIPHPRDEVMAAKQQWMGRINTAWRYKWIIVLSIAAGLVWGLTG